MTHFRKILKDSGDSMLSTEMCRHMSDMLFLVTTPLQLMGVSPGLMAAHTQVMTYYMTHPRLSQKLLALIRIFVAEAFNYTYCESLSKKILLLSGAVSRKELERLDADTDKAPADDRERDLLKVVKEVCTTRKMVSAARIDALEKSGWKRSDIIDAISHGLMVVQSSILEKAQVNQLQQYKPSA